MKLETQTGNTQTKKQASIDLIPQQFYNCNIIPLKPLSKSTTSNYPIPTHQARRLPVETIPNQNVPSWIVEGIQRKPRSNLRG